MNVLCECQKSCSLILRVQDKNLRVVSLAFRAVSLTLRAYNLNKAQVLTLWVNFREVWVFKRLKKKRV